MQADSRYPDVRYKSYVSTVIINWPLALGDIEMGAFSRALIPAIITGYSLSMTLLDPCLAQCRRSFLSPTALFGGSPSPHALVLPQPFIPCCRSMPLVALRQIIFGPCIGMSDSLRALNRLPLVLSDRLTRDMFVGCTSCTSSRHSYWPASS